MAPRVIRRSAVQARLGRNVGMLEIGYPDSPIVAASAVPSGAGRRLPNPGLRLGGRLYQRLDPIGHTWIVRGRQAGAAVDPADPRRAGLPVVFLSDEELTERLDDLAPVVLVRPDRYIVAAGDTAESVRAQLGGLLPGGELEPR